jgi:hypothetical protein
MAATVQLVIQLEYWSRLIVQEVICYFMDAEVIGS